jgi:TonB family protein
MRQFLAIAIGFLLLGATLDSGLVAQETQASGRKIVSRVMPSYPELATKMNMQGVVKLQVTVAPNGTPKSIEVVGGNPVFVKSAENAVDKFRWAPAAEESKELIEIRFRRPGS